MQFRLSLTGTSPLLMHHPQMCDPEFEINRSIKALTAKRKKTDEDLKEIERLEWHGGLYTAPGPDGKPIVTQPTAKVRKCLIGTARIYKQGKQVERAVTFYDMNVPLIYDGPRTPEELILDARFKSRLSVGVNGRRIMRVRPQFFPWALELKGLFVEDAGLNFEDLDRIVQMSGVVEGIGDNRINGYGRFTAEVKPE